MQKEAKDKPETAALGRWLVDAVAAGRAGKGYKLCSIIKRVGKKPALPTSTPKGRRWSVAIIWLTNLIFYR